MMVHNKYIPGICNIGPEEIGRRRNVGWVSLAITLGLLVAMVWTGINPWWRLIIFFPAALSASGFLQAYFHFCSGFARRGQFNFGHIGETSSITDEHSRNIDQRKGNQIILYSSLIGAAIALVALFVMP